MNAIRLRVQKRTKELFKGYPYFVAVDLPRTPHAWYLRADGTVKPECYDGTKDRGKNSGWFATMEEVNAAIALYEARKGEQRCAS